MVLEASAAARENPGLAACARDWEIFASAVQDGTRPRAELARELAAWSDRLRQCFDPADFSLRTVFPVAGYRLEDLGPSAAGYHPRGYRFLDGNRHGGHPAVDIFVHDRNRDNRDDRTGEPVAILAPADGVVMAVVRNWYPGGKTGERRGGNLVWIYHPALGLFSYLAHLDTVRVETGQRVAFGEMVATLGRSGKNAYPALSPTHLHLMFLDGQTMTPVDPMRLLSEAPATEDRRETRPQATVAEAAAN